MAIMEKRDSSDMTAWEMRRVKDFGKIKSGDGITNTMLSEEGAYEVYGGNGVMGRCDVCNQSKDAIIIGRVGALCGNIHVLHEPAFISDNALVLSCDCSVNIDFIAYSLYNANLNKLNNSSAQPLVTGTAIKRQLIAVPSIETQQRIVTYLDSHVASIDKRVSLLTAKRDQYLRLKTAMINRAVRQGLNPDVKMKDSGVEWLGRIPENWNPIRLKDLGILYGGLTGKSGDDFRAETEDGTKPFIPFTNILNNFRIDFDQFKNVVMDANEKDQNVVKNQDLLFLMSSEDYESIAKCSVVDGDPGEVYLNSFCRGFRLHSKNVYAPFISYQLSADIFRDALRFEARGFTRINIKTDRIATMKVCLPPKDEQKAIVEYLDTKSAKIDAIVANLDNQIEKHNLLKRALINEVITGKRAV